MKHKILLFSCLNFLIFLSNQTRKFIKQNKNCILDREYNNEILKNG